jgi:hypothetical protein
MPIGGGSGSGGKGGKDVRAGGAFYELFAKDNLSGVLDRAKQNVKAFVGVVGSAAKGAALAGAGLAAPLAALFKGGVDRAADVARMSQQFGVPIELMSRLQYAAEQAGVSVEEVMNDKAGRYRSLVNSAPTIDGDRARQAVELQREMAAATHALQMALMPLLTPVLKIAKGFGEFVQRNKEYLPTVAAVAVGLLAFAGGVKLLTLGFAALAPAAAAAWAVVSGPVGLAALSAAAGLGLGVLLADWAFGAGELRKGFTDLGRTAKEAFGGIASALGRGDLKSAWDILVAGLKYGWAELVHSLTYGWIKFKSDFLDGRDDIIDSTIVAFFKMGAAIARAITRALGPVFAQFGEIAARLGLSDVAASLGKFAELGKRPDAYWENMMGIGDRWAGDRKRERDRFRAGEMIDADRARDEAKANFGKATAAEKEKSAADLVAQLLAGGAAAATPLRLAEGLRAAEQVKGGFSGAALAQQFGASDQAQKQTELIKQLRDGEGKLPDKIGKSVADNLTIT